MGDRLFDAVSCERCGGGLDARTMSWFTPETICMDCSDREQEFKVMMRSKGFDPGAFEGCGYERLEQLKRDLGLVTRWEVQEDTVVDGWTNTWRDEQGELQRFDSRDDAEAELDTFMVDVELDGLDYDRENYRVVQVEVEA